MRGSTDVGRPNAELNERRAQQEMKFRTEDVSVRTLQAFSSALDPTPEQGSLVRRHFGACRYAYNWTVA